MDKNVNAWIGTCVLVFIAAMILSDGISPAHLSMLLIVVALMISGNMHRSFSMGNMEMVLMLSGDIRTSTSKYLRTCVIRLVSFTLLAIVALIAGISLRVGMDAISSENVAAIGYMALCSDILVIIRWTASIRFGRRSADRWLVWMFLLVMSAPVLTALLGWSTVVLLMIIIILVLATVVVLIHLVSHPSKTKMMDGI